MCALLSSPTCVGSFPLLGAIVVQSQGRLLVAWAPVVEIGSRGVGGWCEGGLYMLTDR